MSLILPMTILLHLGNTFDLRSYSFKPAYVYDSDEVKPFTQIIGINHYSAEYTLIESQIDYRKFLGVDVATNLKILVRDYYYEFQNALKNDAEGPNSDKVQLALKLNLRTVNETVPFDAPQKANWELNDKWRVGTHYVKSIIYGSDVFLRLNIWSRSPEHKAAIRASILSKLGRSGTFDQSFNEKLKEILDVHGTGYTMNFFGTVPFYADNVLPPNVDMMLALKETLPDIVKNQNDGKGYTLFYEMQPVSLLSSNFPQIEVSREILNKLDEIERKYEDLRVANDELHEWFRDTYLTEEQEAKVDEFYEKLDHALSNMTIAIHAMDISTLGNVNQFSEALRAYGYTDDDHKYRKAVASLRQEYPE